MRLPPLAFLSAAAGFIALGTLVPAQTTTPASPKTPATTAAATSPYDQTLKDLLPRLAADDYKTREAAQKELAKLPTIARASLERFAEKAEDPEVKSRLLDRAQEMELDEAIDPPPISIDLKKAALSDVAAALGKATGTKFETWSSGGLFARRCKVSMTDAPFWDVFLAIDKQLPLNFQNYSNPRLMPGNNPITTYARAKGLLILPQAITRTSTVDLQQAPEKMESPAQLSFSYTIFADPRMKIAASASPQLLEVVDDLGNVLLKSERRRQDWWQARQYWSEGVNLTLPEKLGTKIVSVKGILQVSAALAVQTVEVAEFDKNFKEPIKIGNGTINISKFTLGAHNMDIEYDCKFPEPQNVHANDEEGSGHKEHTVSIVLLDANDKEAFSFTFNGGSGSIGHSGRARPALPLKARFSTATRTKDVTIPFELKDLPLPPK